MRGRLGRFVLSAAVAMGLTSSAASAATLKADYRFQNTLDSTVPGAPALQTLGTGVNGFAIETVGALGAPRTVLTFPRATASS
jgi:hypothetical protein